MKRNPSVDVVIPVTRPDVRLLSLLEALGHQSIRPAHILLLNAEESLWKEEYAGNLPDVEVYHVGPGEFFCGSVYNLGAGFCDADIILFMEPDVLPADDRMISKLIRPLHSRSVKVSYARQIPDEKSGIADGYEMLMHFPEESKIKTEEDLAEEGWKTFFCSITCAAYDLEFFRQNGGFPEPCIGSGEIIYAGELIRKGYGVSYTSGAAVICCTRRTGGEIFRRGFDMGVAKAQSRLMFKNARLLKDTEGLEYISGVMSETGMTRYLSKIRVREALFRKGFSMGCRYRKLPQWMREYLSGNKQFWKYYRDSASGITE